MSSESKQNKTDKTIQENESSTNRVQNSTSQRNTSQRRVNERAQSPNDDDNPQSPLSVKHIETNMKEDELIVPTETVEYNDNISKNFIQVSAPTIAANGEPHKIVRSLTILGGYLDYKIVVFRSYGK